MSQLHQQPRGPEGPTGEPPALGLEGQSLYFFLAITVVAFSVSLLIGAQGKFYLAATVMTLPPAAAYVFARMCLVGRPAGFLKDSLENFALDDTAGPLRWTKPCIVEHAAPDGVILEDEGGDGLLFIKSAGSEKWAVSKCYRLEGTTGLWSQESKISEGVRCRTQFLNDSPIGVTVGWHFAPMDEDSSIVDEFAAVTGGCMCERSQTVKEEVESSLRSAIKNGQGRRHNLMVSVSVPWYEPRFLQSVNSSFVQEKIKDVRTRFKLFEAGCLANLSGDGTQVSALSSKDLRAVYRTLLNPSTGRTPIAQDESADPTETLQDLWHSPLKRTDKDASFLLDGLYHQVLTLEKFPVKATAASSAFMSHLVSVPNFRISFVIERLSEKATVQKMRGVLERLRRAVAHSTDPEHRLRLENEILNYERIRSEKARPISLQVIITIWNSDIEALRKQVQDLKSAMRNVGDAEVSAEIVTGFSGAKNLWYQSWPGSPASSYEAGAMLRFVDESTFMLPALSNFRGCSGVPHALFWDPYGSLARLTCFSRSTTSDDPSHLLIMAMSGSGKSQLLLLLLYLLDRAVARVVTVDNGGSLEAYATSHGTSTIRLSPGAPHSINGFQPPRGHILSDERVAFLCDLFVAMAEVQNSPRKVGILCDAIMECYTAAVEVWSRDHPAQVADHPRLAFGLYHWWKQRLGTESTFYEAFLNFKEQREAVKTEWLAKPSGEEVDMWAGMTLGEVIVMKVAVSSFSPMDFPRLSNLVTLLKNRPDEASQELADALKPFTQGGPYGSIFDDITSLDVAAKRFHFELGGITTEKGKALVTHLIANFAQNAFAGMGPDEKGVFATDETLEFLKAPNASSLITRSFRLFRKLRVMCALVSQEYKELAAYPASGAIFGNVRLLMILHQQDSEDIEGLAKRIHLPPAASEEIKRFKLPKRDPHTNAPPTHVDALLLDTSEQPVVCGGVRIVLPRCLINETKP